MSGNQTEKKKPKHEKTPKSASGNPSAADPVTPGVSFDPWPEVATAKKAPEDESTMQDDRAAYQMALEEKQTLINALESEAKNQAIQLEALTAEKNAASAAALGREQELTDELATARNETGALQTQLAALTVELAALTVEKDAVLAQALAKEQELTGQLEASKLRTDEVIAQMDGFVAKVQVQTDEITAERATLQEDIAARDSTIKKLKQDLSDLHSEATTLLNEKDNEISELQVELESIKLNQADISAEGKVGDLSEAFESTRLQQQLQLANEELTHLKSAAKTHVVAPAFTQKAQQRAQEANAAIDRLRNAITPAGDTKADEARKRIITCLEQAFNEADPDAYFKENQAHLKRDLKALGTCGSLFNKAVNAILAVVACLSVVGITLLSLTGNLQSNREKSGSAFAFTMFADRQKAQRDVHTVVTALTDGPRCG